MYSLPGRGGLPTRLGAASLDNEKLQSPTLKRDSQGSREAPWQSFANLHPVKPALNPNAHGSPCNVRSLRLIKLLRLMKTSKDGLCSRNLASGPEDLGLGALKL